MNVNKYNIDKWLTVEVGDVIVNTQGKTYVFNEQSFIDAKKGFPYSGAKTDFHPELSSNLKKLPTIDHIKGKQEVVKIVETLKNDEIDFLEGVDLNIELNTVLLDMITEDPLVSLVTSKNVDGIIAGIVEWRLQGGLDIFKRNTIDPIPLFRGKYRDEDLIRSIYPPYTKFRLFATAGGEKINGEIVYMNEQGEILLDGEEGFIYSGGGEPDSIELFRFYGCSDINMKDGPNMFLNIERMMR